jgi:trimethylamine--corrinoid protein Co-methyltransferase
MKIRRGLSGGQYKPLTEQDIKKIHETSMRFFAEIGVQVNFSESIELFRQEGAELEEIGRS